jgi:hypothetical protein
MFGLIKPSSCTSLCTFIYVYSPVSIPTETVSQPPFTRHSNSPKHKEHKEKHSHTPSSQQSILHRFKTSKNPKKYICRILYLSILLYLYIFQNAQYIPSLTQLFSLLFLLLTTCFGLKRPSSGVLSTPKLSHTIKYIKCSFIYKLANVMCLV